MSCLAPFGSPPPFGPYELCSPWDALGYVFPLFPSQANYLKGGLTKNHHFCWTLLLNASPHALALHLVWELSLSSFFLGNHGSPFC